MELLVYSGRLIPERICPAYFGCPDGSYESSLILPHVIYCLIGAIFTTLLVYNCIQDVTMRPRPITSDVQSAQHYHGTHLIYSIVTHIYSFATCLHSIVMEDLPGVTYFVASNRIYALHFLLQKRVIFFRNPFLHLPLPSFCGFRILIFDFRLPPIQGGL